MPGFDEGGWLLEGEVGCRWLGEVAVVGEAMVVLRAREEVVGALGGGGREARREEVGRREARQRKHSPVP
jgi:hypothetical protein